MPPGVNFGLKSGESAFAQLRCDSRWTGTRQAAHAEENLGLWEHCVRIECRVEGRLEPICGIVPARFAPLTGVC